MEVKLHTQFKMREFAMYQLRNDVTSNVHIRIMYNFP